jgi:type II secretory pathway pseudopilin PulG
MGVQPILLIILSVIIIVAATAVGIQMFSNQSFITNKSAIEAEAQSYANQIAQYYKTLPLQGDTEELGDNITADEIGYLLGWATRPESAVEKETETVTIPSATSTSNDNGFYKVIVVGSGTEANVYVLGLGKKEKNKNHPAVRTAIKLSTGEISTIVKSVAKSTTIETLSAAVFDEEGK